jgi:hypothetical protein
MIKPTQNKIDAHTNIASLIAEFKQRGGVIERLPVGVAGDLKKMRYIGREALRGSRNRLGEN